MTVNDESGATMNVAALAYFKMLSRDLLGETECGLD